MKSEVAGGEEYNPSFTLQSSRFTLHPYFCSFPRRLCAVEFSGRWPWGPAAGAKVAGWRAAGAAWATGSATAGAAVAAGAHFVVGHEDREFG